MKNFILTGIIAALLATVVFLVTQRNNVGGTLPTNIRTATASSSAMDIGSSNSKTVLASYGRRFYASLCNIGTTGVAYNKVYLDFNSSVITATSSADITVNSGECYEINGDNWYYGEVRAIAEFASSSAKFVVTELRY